MSSDYLMDDIMSISMCMQNFITIFHSVQEIGPFSFFQNLDLGKAASDEKCHFAISGARSCQYSMFTQKFIKIFHSVQKIGLFSFLQNLAVGKASTNYKCRFAISWTGYHQYRMQILSKYSKRFLKELSTFFSNRPVTKSSQTVRWQNQMFDYRAHYESQPSVSVDFRRVVQLTFLIVIHWLKESYHVLRHTILFTSTPYMESTEIQFLFLCSFA